MERVLEVRFDLCNTRRPVEVGGAFKVVVETAVIQVDGPHNRLPAVADKDLRVDKAGGVLVNLHPGFQQRGVVGLCQGVGRGLVRHAGQNQPYLHPALCREFQRRLHLPV